MVNYYTLSASIFVVVMVTMLTISEYMVNDIDRLYNNTEYDVNLDKLPTPNKTDVRDRDYLNSDPNTIKNLGIFDQPATEQEQEGAKVTNPGTMAYNIFMNSSVRLASYFTAILGVSQNSVAGYLLLMIQWGVVLNHTILLIQLIFDRLGGA